MPTLIQIKEELYSTIDFLVKSLNIYETITLILRELIPENSIPDIVFSSNYYENISQLLIIRKNYNELCGFPIQIEYLESIVPIIRTTINELWHVHEVLSYKSIHLNHKYSYKIMDDIYDHELQGRITLNQNKSQTSANRPYNLSTNCDLFNFRVNYMFKYYKFINNYLKSHRKKKEILINKLNKHQIKI